MGMTVRNAGRQPSRFVQVFASEAEIAEVGHALEFSGFQVGAAIDPFDEAAAGRPVVATIVSDAVDTPIDLCRALPAGSPIILLTSDAGFDLRLAAARAGVHAILKRPVDPIELLRCIKELDPAAVRDRLSVVLVDDDRLTADLNAEILRSSGIDLEVVNDPRVAVEAIERVLPDLVLMDLRMPDVDGVELAQVLRLSRELMAIPIVFLSAERDGKRQAAARRIGGGDFIHKSIDPEQFIEQVKVRATRAKVLRAMGERDGLTGLLDHSRFRERLTHELSHCRRHGGDLSLVIIDVDRFKAVNDSYGHLVGDQVLRTLAQMLRATLRESDVVGRCGGEEFGIILRNTGVSSATTVIDKFRKRFAATPFDIGGTKLSVTFSAGVASNNGHGSSTELLMAADRAMYAAKRDGRNRVVQDDLGHVQRELTGVLRVEDTGQRAAVALA